MLIIHPQDITTDFLCESYRTLESVVIRNKWCGNSVIKKALKNTDFPVFLGHGDATGLLKEYLFQISYLINSKHVQILREKTGVYVWCYANEFVEKYNLKGFATGMIISEAREALYCKVPFDKHHVDQSNKKLTKALFECFKVPIPMMKQTFHQHYIPETPIEFFNNNNIHYYE